MVGAGELTYRNSSECNPDATPVAKAKAKETPYRVTRTERMSGPSIPTGYDVSEHVSAGRRDRLLTAGFDQHQQHIPRLLVQLHYRVGTDPIE